MEFDSIEYERNGDEVIITFFNNGKRVFSYYHEVREGEKLTLTGVSGMIVGS